GPPRRRGPGRAGAGRRQSDRRPRAPRRPGPPAADLPALPLRRDPSGGRGVARARRRVALPAGGDHQALRAEEARRGVRLAATDAAASPASPATEYRLFV